MLINLWYVAEWSSAVTDKPVKAKLLGQDFVLFRDRAGKVNCLSDICIHRGGKLSNGWTTERDCVACPYHGWEFDAEGNVQFIPSRGEGGDVPERARIDAYPTEERYGMIWVFMGDIAEKDRYPIPPFPEFDDRKNWRAIETEFTWNADVNRVVENGIDIAHTAFVHPGFGHRDMADKNHMVKMDRGDHFGSSHCILYPPPMEGKLGLMRLARKDKAETHVYPGFYLSGHTVRLHIQINCWMSTIIFDANTPVDENTTRSFVIQLRNFFRWPVFDKDSERRTQKVFQEDAQIVEALSPHYLPESLEEEVSVEQDRFMSAWRRVRRAHIEEKGWKVDTRAMEPYLKEKVFTIPSPGRRANPHFRWPLDTVPLVPARKTSSDMVSPLEQQASA
jgi:phenylpropionate dioxygenase-like ring-hydroxylating dioxygenase large terminal subunit